MSYNFEAVHGFTFGIDAIKSLLLMTAIVDKKIKELEDEIKKMKSAVNVIDLKILSKATAAVNEKVRHQGLSAKEILFSRDQFSHANLDLKDETIAEDKMKKREQAKLLVC